MPVIEITLMEGRSQAQKEAVMRNVTHAVSETLDVSPQQIRVILRELQSGHYAIAGEPKYADAPAEKIPATAPAE